MSITTPEDPTYPVRIVGAAIRDLDATIVGPVLIAGDPGYDDEIAGFNVANVLTPEVVVGATNADDVAAAVRYARANNLRIGVRATGHGPIPEGRGYMVITTSRMNDVTVDPVAKTARVGAGARWRDVIAKTAPHGLAGISGSSSSVGVVGYTLGGGLSPLGRRFGFAADRVRSIEVVTADGTVRTVDAGAGSDLFWALLGGRDGFGIVTALEFEVVELATLYGGGIFFAAAAAENILHAWQRWAPNLPEEAGTSIAILRLPPDPQLPLPLQGQTVVHLRFTYVGDPAVGAQLLEPMTTTGPVLLQNIDVIPAAALDAVHMDPPGPLPSVEHGDGLSELPSEAVDAILAAVGPDVVSPLAIVEVRRLGGKLATPQGIPNSVTGRDAEYVVLAVAVPDGPLGDLAGPHLDAVAGAIAPWASSGLLNFAGRRSSAELPTLWSERDRVRLAEIRRRHDPTGVFGRGI
ncbi:FAD-binding oxidoreductase [Gordonia rhizosphera]|uniref:Putative oxidoreductase n=1 Tax=Gordonia rhizosphera NBRC 16068 TaxID=1108045 RepID=K6V9K6_9ACTN|nr:FAD-binding protein [Gordonia rhizosphera]GAB92873.1 putative oxidoreductase [Gordonia rhizosphera NBRC 16068]